MDVVEAIQIEALRAVLHPDDDYVLRRIFRWYSKTFFTPLHEVEDLPIEDVLTAYFEEHFEQMSKKDRRKALLAITHTEEKEEGTSDDEFLKFVQEQDAKDQAALAVKTAETLERVRKALDDIGNRELVANAPKQTLPDIPTAPEAALPEISMSFEDDNLFGEDDGDSVPCPPKKR